MTNQIIISDNEREIVSKSVRTISRICEDLSRLWENKAPTPDEEYLVPPKRKQARGGIDFFAVVMLGLSMVSALAAFAFAFDLAFDFIDYVFSAAVGVAKGDDLFIPLSQKRFSDKRKNRVVKIVGGVMPNHFQAIKFWKDCRDEVWRDIKIISEIALQGGDSFWRRAGKQTDDAAIPIETDAADNLNRKKQDIGSHRWDYDLEAPIDALRDCADLVGWLSHNYYLCYGLPESEMTQDDVISFANLYSNDCTKIPSGADFLPLIKGDEGVLNVVVVEVAGGILTRRAFEWRNFLATKKE